ncbi:TGM1-like protein, partial [Mya arenaria]
SSGSFSPSRTYAEVVLSEEYVSDRWNAYIKSRNGNDVTVAIMTPADTPVGKWRLSIDVIKSVESARAMYRYQFPDPLYILFNPWCRDDIVYMQDERLLAEYILNEAGHMYMGSYTKIRAKPWVFGQFSGDVLDCALLLLEKCLIPDDDLGDPVTIVRRLSAIINSNDDNGVVKGNWSSSYEGGVSPVAWTGSGAILDRYFHTHRPVKYGQCWVYSGVLTSVCRALGIPTRSVSNFNSAHDQDGNITIDYHYNSQGERLHGENFNRDSVWNFHVWNDVWMARADLPTGYGGWQAVDSTPQSQSVYNRLYCMGPCSLRAVKEGRVHLPYDGRFAFAEVNADRVYWSVRPDGSMTPISVKKQSIGKILLTQRPSPDEQPETIAEDITEQYKFPEESDEERMAVREANLHSTMPGLYNQGTQDVQINIESDPGAVIGEDITVTLTFINTVSEERTFNAGQLVLKVPVEVYLEKLVEHCLCVATCIGVVKETEQHVFERDELALRKPDLDIESPLNVNVGQRFTVHVTFENPLPVALTNCELWVEGPGLQKPDVYTQP